MHVFISHSSADSARVEPLATLLRARGIEVWLDVWEIAAGDDIVDRINAGLDRADAALVVFSTLAGASPWVKAEVSYLTYARIQEGKVLIPVEAERQKTTHIASWSAPFPTPALDRHCPIASLTPTSR